MVEAFNIIENATIRNEFYKAFKKLDRIELIQLLSDLKYLPLKAFEDDNVDTKELASAIARFRSDYKDALALPDSSNLNAIRLASEVLELEEPFTNELTKRETFVLKEIVGLDNELIIHRVKAGECTLFSRIIIYRYRVYDLISTVLPNYRITDNVIKKLEKSANEIGFNSDWLELGNLLANQNALSSFCLKSSVLSNKIFGYCIFIELTSKEGRKVIRELGTDIKTKRRFSGAIAAKAAQRTINDLTSHKVSSKVTAQVNGYMDNIANTFMRRVLQVKLWAMGLYQGELDHDFGPLSTKALVEYLMTIIERETKGKEELGRILYNLGNDQCIINIRYLLSKHFIPVEMSDINADHSSVSQIFDFVLEDKTSVKSLKRNKKNIIETESQKLRKTLEVDLRKESITIIKDKKRKVRQYKAKKGIMKFFSKLFKFVKNAFTKLLKLIQKLFRLVKKSIKIIYSEIKEAFQNFRYGLEFLFGNRVIKTKSSITTDYDFDFDGITRVHTKPSRNDLKAHTTMIKRYASALYPTLNFVRIVIKWGLRLTTGPIGWVKILVGIAKLFREMLSQRTKVQWAKF